MKKIFLIIAFIFIATNLWAQKGSRIPKDNSFVVEPTVNDKLELMHNSRKTKRYLVNKNYVIYQDENSSFKTEMDVKTFSYPKYHYVSDLALDKNGIYFKGKKIESDTTGFKIIGEARKKDTINEIDIIWKTKTKIYKNQKNISAGIDVATFTRANGYNDSYYKDKNFIYYQLKKIIGSDPATVSEDNSTENKISDKNHVYINGEIAQYKGENLMPVNQVFMKTSKYVVNNQLIEMPNMNAKTLVGLTRNYAKDDKFIYYQGEKSPIKPKDFSKIRVFDQVNSAYITDGTNIYSGANYLVTGLDAKTFGVIPKSDFYYDKNGIYDRTYNEKTKKVDYVKFPFKNVINLKPTDILKSKNYRYLIYKNQAYDPWDKEYFDNLSPEQIKLVCQNTTEFSKSGKNIVVKNRYNYPIYEADGKIYYNKIETSVDAATFEMVNLYKDKNFVYQIDGQLGFKPIKGIDASTYKRNVCFASDKNYLYYYNQKIIKNTNIEVLATFSGYQQGCSQDTHPSSDFYLLKNDEGYWLTEISNKVVIRSLGQKLEGAWSKFNF